MVPRLILGLSILSCWLGGCNAPAPAFRGIAATRVVVEGSVFDVRVRGARAEAIRVNAQYAPRFGPIRQRARRAMAEVSGCRVLRVTGDQAQAFGRLDCGQGMPPPVRRRPVIDCVPERGSGIEELGQVRVALDCDVEYID